MKLKYVLGLLLVAGASFGWGFLSYRHQVFPFFLIRTVATEADLVYERAEPYPRSKQLDLVKSLPYVHATFDPRQGDSGVITPSSGAPGGYNLYNSWQDSSAYLIDMQGNVLHTWSYNFRDQDWHHVELLPTGDILVVLRGSGVAKLDKHSKLIWYYTGPAHHDLWVHDTGEIFIISGETTRLPELHPELNIFADTIAVLSPDGKLKTEFSLLKALQDSPYRYLLPSLAPERFPAEVKALDILHTNHVEVFDGAKERLWKLYKRGNILVSMKHINAIAILDGETKAILWLWGPTNLSLQHHPQVLDNGNILLFDNGTERSRVIEMEPQSGQIVWKYEDGEAFFSKWGGAAQRLPNGNTLITNTTGGRALEVTPGGKVVWEFANPKVLKGGDRVNIWRMTRYEGSEPGFPKDLLPTHGLEMKGN
jgi:hypothetical protein